MEVVSIEDFGQDLVYFYLNGVIPSGLGTTETSRSIENILGAKTGVLQLGYSIERKCSDFFIKRKHVKILGREKIKEAINKHLKNVEPA